MRRSDHPSLTTSAVRMTIGGMRDPHVVSLRYRLVPDETVSFDNPPPVEWKTEAFRLRLENGIATVEMVEHCASEQAAKERVDPYLRDYEVYIALNRHGLLEIHFEFDEAGTQVIDRNPPPPPPPGSPMIYLEHAFVALVPPTVSVTVHTTRRNYPDPPSQFALSPDAETLWQRYQVYLNGREPLASMGYACLTWLQSVEGGLPKLAEKYNISRDVLRTLRRLTSTVGDAQGARKFDANHQFRPYTGEEKAWVEAAIRALILRLGGYAADPNTPLPKLTMDDLPKLT